MTRSEKFIEDSKIIHHNKYNYDNINYINIHTKVEIICNIHGTFLQKPLYHKNHGCPECGKLSMKSKKTKNDWLSDFVKIHGDKYDYDKVNYINSKTKVEIICSEHGSFLQRPMDHKNGTGCPECGKLKAIRVKNNIIEDFIKIHKNVYDYSKVEYVDNKTKVEIICKQHGSFFQRPSSHRAGSGCPECKVSKGEREIYNILKSNDVVFETQYKFHNCRSKYPLVFDFFLTEYNTCIEYDGIQHFQPIEKWGGVKRYEMQKINDKIKNQFCKNNNIILIRIPYTNFDVIEEVIKKLI